MGNSKLTIEAVIKRWHCTGISSLQTTFQIPVDVLSASISPATIKDANKAVRSATQSQEASHARERGNAQAYMKIKIRKFLLKSLRPFKRKFALPKISRCMVVGPSTAMQSTEMCERSCVCEQWAQEMTLTLWDIATGIFNWSLLTILLHLRNVTHFFMLQAGYGLGMKLGWSLQDYRHHQHCKQVSLYIKTILFNVTATYCV